MVVDVDNRTIIITATDHGESHIDVHGRRIRVWKLVVTCGGIELEWCNTAKGSWIEGRWIAKYPNSRIKYQKA